MVRVYSPRKTRKKRNNKQEASRDYKAVEHARTSKPTRKVNATFTTGNCVQAGPPTDPYTVPQHSRTGAGAEPELDQPALSTGCTPSHKSLRRAQVHETSPSNGDSSAEKFRDSVNLKRTPGEYQIRFIFAFDLISGH